MFKNLKAVAFDLDGTVYYGNKIIDGANDVIKYAKRKGLKIFFLTNNSAKTRAQIYDKLTGMEVECNFEEVITSAYIAALFAKENSLQKIYVFGTDSLREELKLMGADVAEDENAAENLIIGYDPEVTYEGLTKALQAALRAGKIISCNMERSYPGENARIFPGCGAMAAAIEYCAARKADYIIGKPNAYALDFICDINGISPESLLMVGDTYESDIAMAQKKGCPAILITDKAYPDVVCVKNIVEAMECF